MNDLSIMNEEYVFIDHCDFDDETDIEFDFDDLIYTSKNDYMMNSRRGLLNIEYIYFFSFEKYIIDIWRSYKSQLDIYNQFSVDFNRQNIYINNGKCNTIDDFSKIISKIKIHSVENMIYILCNQSSFGLPYEILCNMYNAQYGLSSDNMIVNSLFNAPIEDDDRTSVNIDICKDHVLLLLKTRLFVINQKTHNTIYKILVEINIEIPKIERRCENKTCAVLLWKLKN